MASGVLNVQQWAEVLPERGPVPYQEVSAHPNAFGAPQARALVGIGQAGMELGEELARRAEKDNVNSVLEAYTAGKDQLRTSLYDPKTGYFTRTGGAARGGVAEFNGISQDIMRKAMEKLPPGKARDSFQKMWLNERDTMLDGVARHEAAESKRYDVQVQQGVVDSAINMAASAYNDPKVIAKSVDDIRRAIRVNSIGQPPELIKAAEDEAISGLHLNVISRMAVESPTQASEYYKQNINQIAGKDHVTVSRLLAPGLKKDEVNHHFSRITGVGAAAATLTRANSEALIGSVVEAESGGRPLAVSPTGAAGIMQVQPQTARDIAVKIGDHRMAKLSDAEITRELQDPATGLVYGGMYLQWQLERYNGDIEASLIAYNAGPGNADKWLKAGRDYSVLPKREETEPYVNKVLARYADAIGGKATEWGELPARFEVARGGFPSPGIRMTPDNWNLSFFKPHELMAATPQGQWVDARSATMLDRVATDFFKRTGVRIKVNEDHDFAGKPGQHHPGKRRGTRDPGDNPGVGGSQHLHGRAFDVQIQHLSDAQKADFLRTARQMGFTGIGFYEGGAGHLHLDTGRQRTWGKMPEWARAAMGERVAVTPGAGDSPPPPNRVRVADASQHQQVQSDVAQYAIPVGEPGTYQSTIGIAQYADTQAADLETWLAQADTIEDPEVRDSLKAKLSVEYNRRKNIDEKEQKELENKAWKYVLDGGVDSIPPDLVARLPRTAMTGFMEYEDKVSKRGGIKTNFETYNQLSRMTDEEFKSVNMMDYRNKLDDNDLQLFMNRQNGIINKAPSKDIATVGLRTRTQIIDDTVAELGWTNKDNGKAIGQIGRMVDRDIATYAAMHGKSPTSEDIQAMVDRHILTNKNTGWFSWGEGDTLAETPREDLKDFTAVDDMAQIPEGDMNALVRTFQQFNNRTPAPEEAISIYNEAIRAYAGDTVDIEPEEQNKIIDSFLRKNGRNPTNTEMQLIYRNRLLRYLDM